jgi:hypothetical protein
VTASPTQVNGTKRSDVPILGPWQPVSRDGNATVWEKQPEPAAVEAPAPAGPVAPVVDPVAEAEAEAIRARTAADVEARLIAARAEADAARITAEAEAERIRLANERAAMRMARERAENDAKVAEAQARQRAAERQAKAEEEQAAALEQAEQVEQGKRERSAKSWRKAALFFAAACAVVALPVQMSAFYNPHALWLLAAPIMLEGGAWVVLRGAAAAVDDHRPHWHYRLIAWLLAFVAAAINLSHGLSHFDMATAVGTAFASLAGPGVWDLHEHGRIRKRDGVLTRRERRALRKAEAKAAAEKAAAAKAAADARAAERKAADEAAAKLASAREAAFPDVWKHALNLAAALGETTVTDAVWRRAHRDVKGTDPGDSAEVQQLRNAAERSLLDARSDAPDKAAWKISSSQVNPQVPPTRRRGSVTGPPVRGVRRPGDTARFVEGARKQAAITAKNATTKPAADKPVG